MAIYHHRINSGRKGSASDHSRYIARQGKYSIREDLVYESVGNVPSWAVDIGVYWRASDTHERANGAAYREHVIALPNELSVDQRRELADELARELVGTKTYQLAIHEPVGSLGGISNPHVHIQYSDRINDGIERTPAQTFARYNAKNTALGGCKKDSGGRTPDELRRKVIETRGAIAEMINRALENNGVSDRVDHRTLYAQGKVRAPEHHLGPARVRGMSVQEKKAFAGTRASAATR